MLPSISFYDIMQNHLPILDLFNCFVLEYLNIFHLLLLVMGVAWPSSCIERMSMHKLFDLDTLESPKSIFPKTLRFVL